MNNDNSVYKSIHEAAQLYASQNPRTDVATAYANGCLSMLMYLAENDERALEMKARYLCETQIIKDVANEL